MEDWHDWFSQNASPYFAMFRAGCNGVPLEEATALCSKIGIPLRAKDIDSWKDGNWNYKMRRSNSVLNPKPPKRQQQNYVAVSRAQHLEEFPKWPEGWSGTGKRWFPCNEQNAPMQAWGYKEDFRPNLYEREEAVALSPIGWVGQNTYAQPFVVMDIDGRGHGEDDEQVIAFGNLFRDMTETWEDPAKPGSFHLYFSTEHIIPTCHFGYAKLDFMGNATNYAVYTKNKRSNGLPRARLTDEIYQAMKEYEQIRKEQRSHGQS